MSQGMRAFRVLATKEFHEGVRSYRFWVLLGVLVFFGLLSPLTAKFLPEILGSTLPPGVTLELPPPTFFDSYDQFFSNLAQMGVLTVILVSMGVVADERAKGTAVLVMVRPVSRAGFVLAKVAVQWLMMTVAVVASTAGALAYTYVLFPDAEATGFIIAVLGWVALLAALIALTVLFSVLFSSGVVAGVSAFGSYILLSILPVFGNGLDQFTPGAVSGVGGQIISGASGTDAMIWPVITSLILAAAATAGAVAIFKRQEL